MVKLVQSNEDQDVRATGMTKPRITNTRGATRNVVDNCKIVNPPDEQAGDPQ